MGEERFEQLLKRLPEGWEAKSKELGAFQRARVIQTPADLLRLILLYLTEGKSFAGTSAITSLTGKAAMNKAAVFKRAVHSAAWLQWLCENIYREGGLIVKKPQWLKKKNVKLADGSEVVKCGARRQCHMPHYSLDLFTLTACEFVVTGIDNGEKLANFERFRKGDIVMGDRAYGVIVQSGADSTIQAYFHADEDGKSVDVLGGQLIIR